MFNTAKSLGLAAVLVAMAASAQAATVAMGGTGSTGAGGFTNPMGTGDTDNGAYSHQVTTPASNWVWVDQPATVVGNLDFIFTFDLTHFKAATASLAGLWGVDNLGTVDLNGTQVSQLTYGYDAFNTLHAFNQGMAMFNAGMNTLTFHTTNTEGPGAFRASVQVDASPVPVPAGLPLLGAGLAGLAALRRKRRS